MLQLALLAVKSGRPRVRLIPSRVFQDRLDPPVLSFSPHSARIDHVTHARRLALPRHGMLVCLNDIACRVNRSPPARVPARLLPAPSGRAQPHVSSTRREPTLWSATWACNDLWRSTSRRARRATAA
jgi:hypothetical protein